MLDIRQLLKQYGSPLYVYDRDMIRDKCIKMKIFSEDIERKLNNKVKVTMHYSTKANSQPAILKTIKNCGINVDCMSPEELDINERCGFSPKQMLYVCNNVSAEELFYVHKKGLLICLDSISQVDTFGKMLPGDEIMVRINPGTLGVGHSEKVITSGNNTKFGICENNIEKLYETAEMHNLKIIGVHQHLGSLFLNDKVPNYITGVKAGLEIIKKHFKELKIVDLGGGFGVPYKPEEELNLKYVSGELGPVLEEFIMKYPTVKEFKFEPGRYITCEAGRLLGRVTAVKEENGTWYIGTDIGMNVLVRPSMYGSYHEIALPESKGETITANFCGNVCESGDILGKNRQVNKPEIGDPVVVYNAGAYGYSMCSGYTGRKKPAEVMISNDKCTLVRRREESWQGSSNVIWDNI